MLKDLLYKEPERSILRDRMYQYYDARSEYPIRKRYMLDFGRALAKSGIMKGFNRNDMQCIRALVRWIGINKGLLAYGQRYAIQSLLPRLHRLQQAAPESWEKPLWHGAAWAEDWHGVHMSVDPRFQGYISYAESLDKWEQGNISYAESLDKWEQDKFTTMKPGRYLTKFYSHTLSESEIKGWVEKVALQYQPTELKWAKTEEEIVRVIAEGPSDSCMSNAFHAGDDDHTDYGWYRSDKHPAAVYAGSGDIEVAYLEDKSKHVTARCICNAVDKKAARPYGDRERLARALNSAGYTIESNALVGCRLRVIPQGGKFIMPYVDAGTGPGGGSLYAVRDGQWWVLTDDKGDAQINTYQGYEHKGLASLLPQGEECSGCGDRFPEDYLTFVDCAGESLCESCLEERYVYAMGRRYSDWYDKDDCIKCESDDEWYVEQYAGDHDVYQCIESERWYYVDYLCATINGYALMDRVRGLDVEDSGGNQYALLEDTCQTHDERWVRKDESETRADGLVYHVDDEVVEQQEEGEES